MNSFAITYWKSSMMMIGLLVRRIASTIVALLSVTRIEPVGFSLVAGFQSRDLNGSGFFTACRSSISSGLKLRRLVDFPVPDSPMMRVVIDMVFLGCATGLLGLNCDTKTRFLLRQAFVDALSAVLQSTLVARCSLAWGISAQDTRCEAVAYGL